MPDTDPKQIDPLARRPRESERAHRAFFLYGMQRSEDRSVRAASRAIGRAESTVRDWRGRWSWEERIAALGQLAETKCATAYREVYYPRFRLREIVEVEDRLRTPFKPEAVVSKQVATEVRELVRGEGNSVDTERKKKERQRRQHLALVDGALGLIAKRVASGEVKVSIRDIPTLMDLRHRMTENVESGGTGGVIVESARVRMAKANGEDLLDAVHEDALELVAILSALRSTREVPESLRSSGSE